VRVVDRRRRSGDRYAEVVRTGPAAFRAPVLLVQATAGVVVDLQVLVVRVVHHRRLRHRRLARGTGRQLDVEVVQVDVDPVTAVGLVLGAAVLVDPLMVRPQVSRHVAVGGRRTVTRPAREVDDVRHRVRVVVPDQVGDPGRGAAVDRRLEAAGMQPAGPRVQEGQGQRALRRLVGLHVVADQAARAEAQGGRLVRRVVGRLAALCRR
jgi:hypothetical protein